MLGASSDTVTRCFNTLVFFHLAAKLQYVRFSMEGTCNLGIGESSTSHILEIVGLRAPEKLKIEQLVLLVDESLLGSQGMMLRDCLGQVWASLKLCQSQSLSTKYFDITELANSNEKKKFQLIFLYKGRDPAWWNKHFGNTPKATNLLFFGPLYRLHVCFKSIIA